MYLTFYINLRKVENIWRCLFINNGDSFIKGKVDSTLAEALKRILAKKKMSQQDLIEMLIKNYVLDNLNIIIENENKGS